VKERIYTNPLGPYKAPGFPGVRAMENDNQRPGPGRRLITPIVVRALGRVLGALIAHLLGLS
jgi:hypothetical protein